MPQMGEASKTGGEGVKVPALLKGEKKKEFRRKRNLNKKSRGITKLGNGAGNLVK